MKKYLQNFWARLVACLLCTLSVVGIGAIIIYMIGFASLGSQEEVYAGGCKTIAKNYAAFIYDNMDDEFIEGLDEYLEGKNFDCAIIKVADSLGEDVSVEDKTSVIFSSLPEDTKWDYQFEIEDGSIVHYTLNSVWDALRTTEAIEPLYYTVDTPITGYAFDVNSGIFYYETSVGYFRVDYIFVSQNGETYDYKLTTDDGAEHYYYNNYYGLSLDSTQFEEWDWVEINGVTLTFTSEDTQGRHIHLVGDPSVIEENEYEGVYYENETSISYYKSNRTDNYIIQMKIKDGLMPVDLFYDWEQQVESFYSSEETVTIWLVLFVLLFIISFGLLIFSANNNSEKLGFLHKVPVGILSGCVLLIEIALFILLCNVVGEGLIGYHILPIKSAIVILLLNVGVIALIAFIWIQNMITRFKTRTFFRYSELYYLSRPLVFLSKHIKENVSLFWKSMMVLGVITFVEALVISACWYLPSALFLFFVIGKCIEIPLIIYVLFQMKTLQEGAKRIASGDLSRPIDTRKMFWEFKKHGENINQVSDGISIAVEEQLKSERFKTELITNVSHDIKTPLTSIINYVDLLKKEDLTDPTVCEYVDVLDRQSARLKKLIEDLMEASKASTGNLAVQFAECDVEVLLTQLVGEFEDKLKANKLEVVVNKPAHPVMVIADGRHMWRIFDNLLNNACKYSQENTRVYISLEQEDKKAFITFRNISKSALNIPSDELMERFVRGDSSRNTEGSGLGLSIAQSLTELMNGSMKLDIDGDLFKVTLEFNAMPLKEK